MLKSLLLKRTDLPVRDCLRRSACCLGCLLVPLLASGCANTLLFAEQTSFDLAIHVNNDPVEPVKVNAGLKRYVVAVAPPRQVEESKNSTVATDEAVNLFSGFKLKHEDTSVLNPFAGKLTIRTQFASGDAALAVAGKPQVVEKIVDVNAPIEVRRDETFATEERQRRVNRLLDAVAVLPDEKVKSLASDPPVEDAVVKSMVDRRDPDGKRKSDVEAAREVLKMRVVMGGRSDADLNAWEAAVIGAQ